MVLEKTAPPCSSYQCGRSVPPPAKLIRSGALARMIVRAGAPRRTDLEPTLIRLTTVPVVGATAMLISLFLFRCLCSCFRRNVQLLSDVHEALSAQHAIALEQLADAV